ncbi:MAG: hypothetical protein JAY75_01030 [Candidatus Thiodiazotropha taylori]|nr:hypothetical protein [Candidatus Thiodiazotropha taylori]MCG8104545.1 hypothetical protein [Candidatus Thiodiazotropha taylori]MCW4289879.1 hypothetical protein [Candidatus Thiodiazotropha endolucinida]MCW4306787.1 hypothetical protein [Candidatus Thiodiazotropha endolucinida]
MENDKNQPSQLAIGNDNMESDVSDGEFSGFGSDAAGSDIEIDDYSSVSTVHTADLSDFDDDLSDGESNGSDDDANAQQARWQVNDRSDVGKSPFGGPQPGPTIILGPEDNELDFFNLFFPRFLLELIVAQTNLYARQKNAQRPDPNWREVSMREMLAWLGMRVYMSILQLPQTAMYWSTDSLFGNLNIRRVMKRDRFDKISQYFHLADRRRNPQQGQPGHDKLHLVRPVLQAVQDACLRNYNPNQNVSVDEAMVKFRGRLSFRQYLPAKPTKYGIKVWMRADPTNGYTNEFQVYTGREGNNREVGLATRVVLDLTRRIWGHFHIVNTDNYFTSPELAHQLLRHDTYLRGTVRNNRKGYPSQLLHKRDVRDQGQFKTATKGHLTACVWMDKKPIYTLSTAENPANLVTAVQRKSRRGEVRQVPAPSIIPEYNSNMNGVDVADQLRTEYSTYRTSKKWWRYLFWFLFDLAVTNGFILMRESTNHQRRTKNNRAKVRTMVEFRMNLAKLLISDFTDNETAALATVQAGHFSSKGEKRGRCRQCSKDKRRRDVIWMCRQCNIHLCVDCFQPYHRDLAKNK